MASPDSRRAVAARGAQPRGPGRPRAVPTAAPSDTREEILDAAAALFTAQGYAATGTREIAAKVGLRQASLFHYFVHKDDLLAELLDRTVTPTLESTAWLDDSPGEPHVRLYLLARSDAANLCGGPPNLGVLQLLPEARARRFAAFWHKRATLRSRYERLIHETAIQGLLIDVPEKVVTDLVFGDIEAAMTWYDGTPPLAPSCVAEVIASAAVRGVLRSPPSHSRLRAAGTRVLHKQGSIHG
jgi:AcrR family transcriptional regulator